ncbi:MAG TPA: HD domain-containing protein [Acidimicrobiales bacterium]|nr:HD domain-containing protein [Acidimicrobiales bacterium]
MSVNTYAQTNLQLCNQLTEFGYDERDIVLVHQAYWLAVKLFSGQFRSSGKPFLAHLVGTASVLTAVNAPAPVVVAGLLHAAYASGEWGDGQGKALNDERRRVLRALDDQVEELVRLYTELRWDARTIPDINARLDRLSASERAVVLVRLANLMEDYLDLGMAYSRKGEKEKQADPVLELSVLMAEHLGQPHLASELRRVFDENRAAEIAPGLTSDERSSFTVAPLSHRVRPSVALKQLSHKASAVKKGLRRRGLLVR